MVLNAKCFLTFKKSVNLELLYMPDEDDVIKSIKRISSQKILEKLELIEKKIDD